ncbi:hypothetical protein D7U89_21900 [Stenotrophomonas maltophilia]|uniref:Uncharacterized protein n=1 Tax=Stenotrophomonas maltophilia TaxID=40324 RepID=A0A270N3J5_STEMA|nr:hypothetical protein [Stenotrophomonas maltophilia]MBA0368972.1 hypothetical protein [Stenotrophomonas maltophilia]PAM66703.1 hypothetical protein CEK00_20800 [Stenotrophomonas maltophilia]
MVIELRGSTLVFIAIAESPKIILFQALCHVHDAAIEVWPAACPIYADTSVWIRDYDIYA